MVSKCVDYIKTNYSCDAKQTEIFVQLNICAKIKIKDEDMKEMTKMGALSAFVLYKATYENVSWQTKYLNYGINKCLFTLKNTVLC